MADDLCCFLGINFQKKGNIPPSVKAGKLWNSMPNWRRDLRVKWNNLEEVKQKTPRRWKHHRGVYLLINFMPFGLWAPQSDPILASRSKPRRPFQKLHADLPPPKDEKTTLATVKTAVARADEENDAKKRNHYYGTKAPRLGTRRGVDIVIPCWYFYKIATFISALAPTPQIRGWRKTHPKRCLIRHRSFWL